MRVTFIEVAEVKIGKESRGRNDRESVFLKDEDHSRTRSKSKQEKGCQMNRREKSIWHKGYLFILTPLGTGTIEESLCCPVTI